MLSWLSITEVLTYYLIALIIAFQLLYRPLSIYHYKEYNWNIRVAVYPLSILNEKPNYIASAYTQSQ